MSSIQHKNRIIYIEPNNLPGEYAAKSDGIKPDIITWAPEDLNILSTFRLLFLQEYIGLQMLTTIVQKTLHSQFYPVLS